MPTLKEKWFESVERKNSVLCAGIDPPESELERELKLPENVDKVAWTLEYIKSVAPFCAAIKTNAKFWEGEYDITGLKEIINLAHSLNLPVLDDYKAADLNDTNDSGIRFQKSIGFDALTIAPYGGNMEGTAELCRKHNIGAITMCLMSNKEYAREKNMWMEVEMLTYDIKDIEVIREKTCVRRYIQLAHDAALFNLDGIVVGAPSPDNHITEEELANVSRYFKELILSPGLGKQKGEANLLFKYFGPRNVIANVGTDLMFPNKNPNATHKEQAAAAEYYNNMLNEKRAA